MSSLFSSPETPQEDPAIARQRKAEQDRAERDRTKSVQENLQAETQIRNQGFGIASLRQTGLVSPLNRRNLTSLLGG